MFYFYFISIDRPLYVIRILYESPDLSPLLKIEWNKLDPNYIATIQTDSYKAIILGRFMFRSIHI